MQIIDTVNRKAVGAPVHSRRERQGHSRGTTLPVAEGELVETLASLPLTSNKEFQSQTYKMLEMLKNNKAGS